MTEVDKEELRQLCRANERPQVHLWDLYAGCDERRHRLPQESQEERELRQECRRILRDEMFRWADPIPDVTEYVTGIPSYNAHRMGQLEPVVQAVATRKMHYLTKLQGAMRSDPNLPFSEAFPDCSPASGGLRVLQPAQWRELCHNFRLQDRADYVKHLVNKHDGEARLTRSEWVPFVPGLHDSEIVTPLNRPSGNTNSRMGTPHAVG